MRWDNLKSESPGKATPPLPEAAPFTGSLNIAFGELRDFSDISSNQCRYPTGEFFCGVETPDGHSWCSHHRGIVFGQVPYQLSENERHRRAGVMRRTGLVPTSVAYGEIDSLGAASV